MWRMSLVAGMVGGCLILGCRKGVEPEASSAATSPTTSTTSSQAAAPEAKPVSTTNPPAAQVNEKPANAQLRDLAAHYLDTDGQGGWHKNEKAATEMEKLSAEETEQLWPLLKDSRVEVRRGAAVFLLGQFDPVASHQVAAFAELLEDTDAMVRARAIDAVRQFSRQDQIAALARVETLLDPKREERVENRVAAARLFGAAKPDSGGTYPLIYSAARTDPAPSVRSASLLAIAQIGDQESLVPTLVQGLNDHDPSVRLVAAARLRQLGPAEASPQLATALSDTDSRVAEAAAEALIRIGPKAVEPLAKQLPAGNAAARKLALACLAKMGPAAKAAQAEIEKCKQDSDPQVKQLAEVALMRIAGQ